jgi:NTP pyrophosphatase (non-canonical NTP hydrolase)
VFFVLLVDPTWIAYALIDMPSLDQTTTIQQIRDALRKFRDERDWEQFHTPKDLAIATSIEAGELNEHFLWKTNEEVRAMLQDPAKMEEIGDELADVFNYILCLANVLNIDVASTALRKLEKNNQKYPVEKAKGSSKKYTEL